MLYCCRCCLSWALCGLSRSFHIGESFVYSLKFGWILFKDTNDIIFPFLDCRVYCCFWSKFRIFVYQNWAFIHTLQHRGIDSPFVSCTHIGSSYGSDITLDLLNFILNQRTCCKSNISRHAWLLKRCESFGLVGGGLLAPLRILSTLTVKGSDFVLLFQAILERFQLRELVYSTLVNFFNACKRSASDCFLIVS